MLSLQSSSNKAGLLLNDQIKETEPYAEVDRDILVSKLRRDAQRLLDDPSCMKELIREDIIHTVADPALKEKRPHLELLPSCERTWLPR